MVNLCGGCGKPLPPKPPGRGRPRRYHDENCRWRARSKRRSSSWQSIGSELAEIPLDPLTRQTRTLEALALAAAGEPAGPPEDQLAGCLLEIGTTAWVLQRLERELPAQLAAASAALAGDLKSAVAMRFGEGIL